MDFSTIDTAAKRCTWKLPLSVACSVFVRWLIPVAYRTSYSIGVLPVFTALALFLLFSYADWIAQEEKLSKTEMRCTLIVAIYFTLVFTFGAGVNAGQCQLNYRSPWLYISMIFNTLMFWAFETAIWLTLAKSSKLSLHNLLAHRSDDWSNRKLAIACFVLIIVCWIPIFLAAYPGFLNYDAGSIWLGEWANYSSGHLNNHHSVLHTILFGTFIKASIDFTGDPNPGVALFSAIQATYAAAVFAYSIVWLRSNGASAFMRKLALIFWCLSPLVSLFIFSSNSDTLFSITFQLALILLDDCLVGNTGVGKRIALTCTVFLASALRPNAPIVFILIVAICILFKKKTKALVTTSLIPLILGLLFFGIWIGPVSKALNVEDSELQSVNAFALPTQQIAYAYSNGLLSREEVTLLQAHGYVKPDSYNPGLSDYARSSVFGMRKTQLLTDWIVIGLHHPGPYASAMILQTKSAWSPYSWIDSAVTGDHETSLYECVTKDPARSDSKIPWLLTILSHISNDLCLQKIPYMALLVSIPSYMALLVIAILSTIGGNTNHKIVCFCLLLLVLSVLLGPGVITRYYLPIILFAPILCFFVYDTALNRESSSF